MKISYDKKIDAMYIYLNPKKKVTETKEADGGWIVDYAGKDIVGIEILAASKVIGSKFGVRKVGSARSVSFAHKIKI